MLKGDQLPEYEEVWAFDTEFGGGDSGERYRPVCVTAFELRTRRTIELRRDQLGPIPPYRVDSKALLICYGATAECGTHLALNWPLPANLIDLMIDSGESATALKKRIGAENDLRPRTAIAAIDKGLKILCSIRGTLHD